MVSRNLRILTHRNSKYFNLKAIFAGLEIELFGEALENHDANETQSTEIDRRVGERLRVFRLARGYTQKDVAERVGLSFQQVQKYEQGLNRITAGRLWQLASILEVDIQDFFSSVGADVLDAKSCDARVFQTAAILESISDHETRRSLLDLIESCAKASVSQEALKLRVS